MFCLPASICRDVGLLKATLYQITLREVTRQTGVYEMGQTGPSATTSAMWPKGQSQISPWLPLNVLWLPASLSFSGAPTFPSAYSNPLFLSSMPQGIFCFLILWNISNVYKSSEDSIINAQLQKSCVIHSDSFPHTLHYLKVESQISYNFIHKYCKSC